MIVEILEAEGPQLGSALMRALARRGLSPDAARKRVSRAPAEVLRLQGLNLPHREGFYYLQRHFRDHRSFLKSLTEALRSTGSSYGWALDALWARDGAMPLSQFRVASGFPVSESRNHITFDRALKELRDCRVVHGSNDAEGGYIALNGVESGKKHKARAEVEALFLDVIRNWLRKTGVVSSNKVSIRGEASNPTFAQFEWDLVGPSYLTAIRGSGARVVGPGFVAGDVLLGKRVRLNQIRGFLAKCDIVLAQRRNQRFQPFFAADGFELDALRELRKRGVFLCIPTTFIGEEAAEAIRQLFKLLERNTPTLAEDADSDFSIFRRIQKLEGAAGNLRGIALTFIVAHYFANAGYGPVDVLREIDSLEGRTDIDVLARNRRETVVIECKGMAPRNCVGVPEIREWERKTLRRTKLWLSELADPPPITRFIFISATGYTEEALALTQQIEANHRRQPVEFWNGARLEKKLRELHLQSVLRAFRDQYPDEDT